MKIKESYKRVRAEFLGRDPFLMKLFCKTFYRPKEGSLAEKLSTLNKSPFYFIQVGGNDGFANDPIFRFVKKFGWKGIIIEPQKEVFKNRLAVTYRNEKNVSLENAAVAAETGIKKLYKIAVSNSRWATGLATFNYDVMLERIKNNNRIKDRAAKEGVPYLENDEDYITYEEVPCITLSDLMNKYKFPQLNLLQIDTEGFDYEVIKTIDFNNFKPEIISFEHHLLSEIDQQKCWKLLTDQGYKIQQFKGDTLAF